MFAQAAMPNSEVPYGLVCKPVVCVNQVSARLGRARAVKELINTYPGPWSTQGVITNQMPGPDDGQAQARALAQLTVILFTHLSGPRNVR